MMELILERGYALSVALDGGALVATYPYDRPVQPGNLASLSPWPHWFQNPVLLILSCRDVFLMDPRPCEIQT